ncbi:AT-hook motif nuclear-localized protein 1-like [Rutidosis leptorrhynchoides]|uniref:AT-hook motif nuclear-localized protein 1-like n=1 Tax=Rutidosis leptorrhynchoides TaxID=125765 RepID=UPI003A996AC5
MESRQNMIPAVETAKPEAPSTYQLSLKTDSPPGHQSANPDLYPNPNPNPNQMMVPTAPPGISPVSGGMPSSLAKKKRGRPRKYGPDGVAASGGTPGRKLSPMTLSSVASPTSGGYSELRFGEPATSGGEFQSEKKRRKRMSSSEKLNMSLGDQITSGGSFTPHMVTVNPGEDVTSKIISFSRYGPRAICVLSALGIISHVTLRQASSSGGTVTYEGRFEILSLSGSFTPGSAGGMSSREGGLSITLSSPDGRVVGGLLGGLLTAAGPVQVVVASFLPDVGDSVGPKPKKQKDITRLLSPMVDPTLSRVTHVEHHNFNEQTQDDSPTTGHINSSLATPNYQHDRTPMPNMHDWRRGPTDMNVSLRDD